MPFFEKKGERPPCEDCFPGVDPANVEAWDVFNLLGFEEFGPSADSIIKIGEAIGVDDVVELLQKVSTLIRGVRSGN